MKLFIDSAIFSEIEPLYSTGMMDGVTTNPSLMKKAVEELRAGGGNMTLLDYITKILQVAKGTPVSLEVAATSCQGMIDEGRRIFDRFNPVAENVYVKIPVNPALSDGQSDWLFFDGLRAISILTEQGIPINCTLVFTPEQALLAAKAGAKFVSPFVGRIDDSLRKLAGQTAEKGSYFPRGGMKGSGGFYEDNGIVSGVDLVRQCAEMFGVQGIECEVLAASIRNPRQLREVAIVGADIATVPYKIIKDSLHHPKTLEGMRDFVKDVVPEYAALLR